MAPSQTSERFYAAGSDITIISSDGVLFKLHRMNLKVHSVVFGGADSTTLPENGDEPVQLSETSDVLDLLFQFMYPQLQPELEKLGFEICAGLAEAVEKYIVYSALRWCRMKMSDSIPDHPFEVLNYALKHGHVDIADEAARQSMGHGVANAMKLLAPDTFKTWILFQERWNRATAKYIKSLLDNREYVSLVQECLSDRNPCYTFREELKNAWNYSTHQDIMKMGFTAPEDSS
ncbi:hypothetical protein C8R44DRAFT_724686 [Mycena epipterygia]|nr:hypothetical protein C8R44DRAFT_724686 [Mycena epipterygia]